MKKFVTMLLALTLIAACSIAFVACTEGYKVKFDTNDGSTIKTQTVKEGEKATKPATDPTKDGFDFVGWFTEKEAGVEFDFDTLITGDITIYAQWTETEVEETDYQVTFDTDDGSAVTAQTVKEGDKATRPATDPTKEGFDFAGWFTEKDGDVEFDFNTVITGDTTIYAQWTEVTEDEEDEEGEEDEDGEEDEEDGEEE